MSKTPPLTPSPRSALFVAAFGVFLPAACFFYSARARYEPADSLPVVATAARMLVHGDRDLSYLLPSDHKTEILPHYLVEVPDKPGVYSSYPAGMEFFAWPGVVVAKLAGRDPEDLATRYRIEIASAAITAAASLALFFLAALRVGSPAAAAVATFFLATGSVFPTTLGQLLWQQTGVVFWSLVVLLVELRANEKVGTGGTILQGFACAMMIACRPSAATFVLPFGAWVLARDRRRAVVLVASASVAYLPWAALYQITYGQPLGPALGFVTGHHASDAYQPTGNGWNFGRFLGGVLFSPGRGLFVYQPWIVLALLLLVPAICRDTGHALPRGWYAFAIAFLAFHLAVVGSWRVWWGGVCWGSRLAAEVVPVCGLLAVRPTGFLLMRRWGRALLLVIALAGLAVHAPAMFGSALQWNNRPPGIDRDPTPLWDWSNPPFLFR